MLTEQQAFGCDADKSTPTGVLWEDLPHYGDIRRQVDERSDAETRATFPYPLDSCGNWDTFRRAKSDLVKKYLPAGPMLAREVMEQFMEGVMRKMYPPSVKFPCLKQIADEAPDVALVADLRRREELEGVLAAGGKVVRLTRTTPSAAANTHISNVDLDADRFDWTRFSAVIDNHGRGVRDSCLLLAEAMGYWGWLRPDFDPCRLTYPA
jgi:hypothetical protein